MMLNHFQKGIRYCTGGIEIFFRTPELWKYAVIPSLIMLAVYMLSVLLIWHGSGWAVQYLENRISSLPSWISWSAEIIGFITRILILILSIVLMLFTVSSVYELLAGPFFDRLIKLFYQKYHSKIYPDPDWMTSLRYLQDSLCCGITTLLWLIPSGLAALLIPVAGPALLFAAASYRLGITLILPSGFICGYRMNRQQQCLKYKRMTVAGFGTAAYCIMVFLPVLSLFLLPGIILGGAKLFADEALPENQ